MPYFSMSKLALKWAFKKPATGSYPFTPRRMIPKTRGLLVFQAATCTFCGVCAKKCPTKALGVTRKPNVWSIDRLRCINCGYCVDICPKKSLEQSGSHGDAAVTKDKEVFLPAPVTP